MANEDITRFVRPDPHDGQAGRRARRAIITWAATPPHAAHSYS
jgi:hypothetical protein